MTWFNGNLKGRILDVLIEKTKNKTTRAWHVEIGDEKRKVDPLEIQVDEKQNPNFSVEFIHLIEKIQIFLFQHQASLSRRCVPGQPQANCHTILLKMLPAKNQETQNYWEPGSTLTDLAKELDVDESVLNRCYREKCLPALRKYVPEIKDFLDENCS